MIDFHSHILPGIDDGSSSVEESIKMLDLLREQQVTLVAATPHFYANEQSVERFIQRRQAAYESIIPHMTEDHPVIRLGAEVRYYQGIAHLKELRDLCLEGTRLLLLEMPSTRWTEYTVRELLEIANTRGVTLVLAHIERYMRLQSSGVFDTLLENGVLMQVNASYFNDALTRGRALKLLRNQRIHLLGSDCHGIRVRPPAIGQAAEIIRRKLGEDFLHQFNGFVTGQIPV